MISDSKINKHITVSVVIPCLNRADFLVPTIESVLQQDYPKIECIVIDGGSTDNTVEILRNYGTDIIWVSEPDNGHADAINKGWKMSRGEVLAWLNADDVWEFPDAVSQVIKYFHDHADVDVIYGNCGSIDADGNLVGMSYLHDWELDYAVENCDHCIPQPAAFIKRKILEKIGWLDTNILKTDHELWLRIGLNGKIKHIPITLASARNIRGHSFDGTRMAPSCIQVTKKFFSLENIPPTLLLKKRRAFSNSYVKGMDYAFEGGREWRMCLRYALKATCTDPLNILKVIRHIRCYLIKELEERKRLRLLLIVLHTPHISRKILDYLQLLMSKLKQPQTPNLLGDRSIEWSWIAAKIPSGPGEALDFGTGDSLIPLIALSRGFKISAIDIQPVNWPFIHPNLQFIRGDLMKLPLPKKHYDLIINCSVIEHVGLAGRYGITEDHPDGDLETMTHLINLMKPDGIMLISIPVGQDEVFAPMCRVYGRKRLPRLLNGYVVNEETYWIKDDKNRWIQCNKEKALNFKGSAGAISPLENVYALGCFELKLP